MSAYAIATEAETLTAPGPQAGVTRRPAPRRRVGATAAQGGLHRAGRGVGGRRHPSGASKRTAAGCWTRRRRRTAEAWCRTASRVDCAADAPRGSVRGKPRAGRVRLQKAGLRRALCQSTSRIELRAVSEARGVFGRRQLVGTRATSWTRSWRSREADPTPSMWTIRLLVSAADAWNGASVGAGAAALDR